MKLHTLELEGFGPFRDAQRIDFDAYSADGIFLISGRTGAGKSSILDGVSFALFGMLARYEGGGDKRIRSDHCSPEDRTRVCLEFTAGTRRLRVSRVPEYERPAKRGGGMTTETARAELEEFRDGEWVGVAAGLRNVGIAIDEIVGLNAQQFHQVILLAQNKFSRFLLAAPGERKSLLRTLFDSSRFSDYATALAERATAARQSIAHLTVEAETLLGRAEALAVENELGEVVDGSARRPALDAVFQRAQYRHDVAARELDAADARLVAVREAHRNATEAARRRADLTRARGELAKAESAAEALDADRARRDRARAADSLRAVVAAAEEAEALCRRAERAAETTRASWAALTPDPSVDPAHRAQDLTGQIALWESARAQEEQLTALDAEHAHLAAAVSAAHERLRALTVSQNARDEERRTLTATYARVAEVAARREAVSAAHALAETRADAAQTAAALEQQCTAATQDYLAATEVARAHREVVAHLIRRRFAGFAGELATQLVTGEACAVCGSTEHPAPAPPADDEVTEDAIAEAERARDDAGEQEQAAGRHAADLRQALSSAQARADGLGVAEAIAARDTHAALLREVEAATTQRDVAAARIEALDAEDADAAADRAAQDAEITRIRETLIEVTSTRDEMRRAITTARGDFPTVQARVDHARLERDAAHAAHDAEAECTRARAAQKTAQAARDEAISASDFADAEAVAAALLSPDELSALVEDISSRHERVVSARARTLELELAVVGDDPNVDVDAHEAAVAEADATRLRAVRAERDAAHLVAQIGAHLADADAVLASVTERAEDAEALQRLADSVAGRAPNTLRMDLETFVLAAELEEIVAAANSRLGEMSLGRYQLRHTDALAAHGAASGLGLDVCDAHTGAHRAPQSLSGGETFLASLALALGLAEVVTARAGGIRLDTLFIDEGFGSLDGETLERAMETLDELRSGGRTVGVISHVDAMKEMIPAQLRVEVGPGGISAVRQEASADAARG